jgi:hypothetical protein
MEPNAGIYKFLLSLIVLSLAIWGTSCASSTTQQETTSQQKTQQGTIQRATTAQVSSSTTPSSDRAAQLVGTWEAQSIQDQPLPAGTTAHLTFLNDGTLKGSGNVGSQATNLTGQYSVLDDSHLQVSINGDTQVWEYSLSGNTLRVTGQGVTSTYQRTGGD